MSTATIETYPIADIEIGSRFRKEIGDLTELMASIEEIGLLHPIVLTADHKLIAGARRLEAMRRLGWTNTPVSIVSHIEQATELLVAERDENTCREPMKPSELVALGMRIEEIEAPLAAARKLESLAKANEVRRRIANSENPEEERFRSDDRNGGEVKDRSKETREIVGSGLGVSGSRYGRMKTVVKATMSENPDVRAVALEAVEEMDRTGLVEPAARKVKQAKDSAPPPGKFATWDKTTDKYKQTVGKVIQGVWDSINRLHVASPDLAKMDMEVLLDNLSPAELKQMEAMVADAMKNLRTFQRHLRERIPTEKETI